MFCPALWALVAGDCAVNVPMQHLHDKLFGTLPTSYCSPTGFLAATRALLQVRAFHRRPHLVVRDADGEPVLAFGAFVFDVHFTSRCPSRQDEHVIVIMNRRNSVDRSHLSWFKPAKKSHWSLRLILDRRFIDRNSGLCHQVHRLL